VVASWNLKELGHTTQRLSEACFYMVEIIAHFDLVVIQEIKSSVKDLEILLWFLGDDWTSTRWYCAGDRSVHPA
jgi:hypothetical protein